MKLFDQTLDLLARSLDVRLARHAALAHDAANADTPGFRPVDVDFQGAMAAAGDGQAEGAPSPRPGELPLDRSPALIGTHEVPGKPGLDGNEVDLDRVMTELASNALGYDASAKAVSRRLATLRYVASDGNG